ncbi:MAG: hypothetical protein RL095_2134 [Verrucomicrobiota bacterium]|jgi:DGQHR domain-containing protein
MSTKKSQKKNFCYSGFIFSQRSSIKAPKMFVFSASPSEILEWATVSRTAEQPQGVQRMLSESRVKAISRFLKSDDKNTIPNSAIIALPPKSFKLISNNAIEILNSDDKPGLIVDGQHRIHGISYFESNISKEKNNIVVTVLLDADAEEQAFQFISINNKASRVRTDNVKTIISRSINENGLSIRLINAGISYGEQSPLLKDCDTLDESPFKGMLKWESDDSETKLITLSTIEKSVMHLKESFKFIESDETPFRDLLFAIWTGIKTHHAHIWKIECNLQKKVSMLAYNRFIAGKIREKWLDESIDISNYIEIQKYSCKLSSMIPDDFWNCKWKIEIKESKTVEDMIYNDLDRIIANHRTQKIWHFKLSLLENSDDY